MNRVFKQLAIFLSLLTASIVFTYPYGDLIKNAINNTTTAAGNKTFRVSVEQLQANLFGRGSFSGLLIFLNANDFPIPIRIDSGEFKFHWLSLFSLTPKIALSASAYGGQISTLLAFSLFSSSVAKEATFSNVELAKHPLFSNFGITGLADLEMNFEAESLLLKGTNNFIKLNIADGSYQGGHTLFGIIKLPSINTINISLSAIAEQEKVFLQKFSFSSSLGRTTGIAELEISRNNLPYNATFEIDLEPQGEQIFGGYLGLLAGDVEIKSRRWNLSLTGDQFAINSVKAIPKR